MKINQLKLEENILIALSLIMIWGALIYYLYSLSWIGISLTLILSGLSFYLRNKLQRKTLNDEIIAILPQKNWPHVWWPIVIYAALSAAAFYFLFKNASSAALISPWSLVSKKFFYLYFFSTVWLFYVLNRQLKPATKLWLLRIHYFLAFSVALIIYKIGYGFDPFIHQATMELIDKQGYVDPKPLYYLGNYSLVVILHKLSGLSIYLLNKFLVPVLAALFLPGAIFTFLKNWGSPKRLSTIILILLALPLNLFILSTPQNLTYLWLLLVIFYSLSPHLKYLPIILAAATLSIHPLGGLPAIFFVIWNELLKNKSKLKMIWWRLINIILWIFAALSIPLSFTLVTGQSWRDLSFSLSGLLSVFKLSAVSTNLGSFVLNFSYFLVNSWLFVFILLAISGTVIWFKKNKGEAYVFLKMFSALLFGFLISASLSFSFLIDYERNNYISRLPILMALFALPTFILTINYLVTKVWRATKIELTAAWLLIGLLITASLYLSYPRLDAYINSRGYSVSQADLLAVNSIAKQTAKPYIVLANQQTSVASLKELGFNHYFNTASGPIFFYPIPTGGQLYQYYLDMVNKNPEASTMASAMDLVGVNESYFVISKYWWLSDRLIAEAKLQADSFWQVSNGDIYIFKFSR